MKTFGAYLKEELEGSEEEETKTPDSFDDLTSDEGSAGGSTEGTEEGNSTGKGVPRPKAPGMNDGTKTREGESIPEQKPGNLRSQITGQIGYAKSLLAGLQGENVEKLTASLDKINELVRGLEI